MAEEKSGQAEPFDLDRLRQLIEMMEQHGVTEVTLRRANERWHLRRGPQEVVQAAQPAAYVPQPAVPAPAAPASPAEQRPAEPAPSSGLTIKSPTVGTFYSSPSPDDPPFVTVGSRVQPDTIVCLVEAMKVFNQIPAEVSGIISEVLVQNGDSVEFGQPLFRVQPG